MGMLTREHVEQMGFASIGENVLISDRASFYNPSKISLGSNVRIDDFCVFSAGLGGISIGNYIHIAVYSLLIGAGKFYCLIIVISHLGSQYIQAMMIIPARL